MGGTVPEMRPRVRSEEAISEYTWPQIHDNPMIKWVTERSYMLNSESLSWPEVSVQEGTASVSVETPGFGNGIELG